MIQPTPVSMIAWMAVVFGFALCARAQDEISQYRLATGDTIEISVFQEPDLHKVIEIGSSGEISYPLIGNFAATGLTVSELREGVETRLRGRFLKDPKVNVVITEYRDFYINGAVVTPGSYPYQPGLTVRKAISIAGGLTERASSRKIYLMREADADKVFSKVDMEQVVGPGDIVQIDEGLF